MSGVTPFPPCHYLQLVPPVPHLRHGRLGVRIVADDGRCPYGRSKIFRLTERDLEQLVDAALRLEARR